MLFEFCYWLLFFIIWDSRFFSSWKPGPANSSWGSFKLFSPPGLFFWSEGGRKRSSRRRFWTGDERTVGACFKERTVDACFKERTLERVMESDGVDLDLAGSALLHDKFVPGWSTLASSAFVWPFAEFLLGFFLKPLCRNSFLC